jgi:hypothetical protein
VAKKKRAKPPLMTEAEWLASDDASRMLTWVLSQQAAREGFARPGDRSLRLLACTCLRSIWSYLNPQNRSYVEWQESHPDVAPKGQREIRGSAWADHLRAGGGTVIQIAGVTREGALSNGGGIAPAQQAELVREFVGNPFRQVAVAPAWRTADVVRLAADAYANRAFHLFPILADALEDAGCTDAAILTHLRAPGPHLRGCWALDAVLGKE